MNKFEVGEIAIIGWSYTTSDIGSEVEILSSLYMDEEGYMVHDVKLEYRENTSWQPKYLRKKKPPLSTWDKVTADTLWNPLKDEVTA